jgi:hypothetical protein
LICSSSHGRGTLVWTYDTAAHGIGKLPLGAIGIVQQLTDSAGHTHWSANGRDAEQHLTQQTAGNGIVTIQSFDQVTGRLAGIVAGINTTFSYDGNGNQTAGLPPCAGCIA